MWILILCLTISAVSCNDLLIGKEGGRKIFDEIKEATPAIWKQVHNITINATDNEAIGRVVVTDLRPNKDGEAKIIEGGEGQKNVTIELKSPAVFRGFEFQIQVYAVPDRNSRDTSAIMNDTNVNYDNVKMSDDSEAMNVSTVKTKDTSDKVNIPVATGMEEVEMEKRDAQETSIEDTTDSDDDEESNGDVASDRVNVLVSTNVHDDIQNKRDTSVVAGQSTDNTSMINTIKTTGINETQDKRDTNTQTGQDQVALYVHPLPEATAQDTTLTGTGYEETNATELMDSMTIAANDTSPTEVAQTKEKRDIEEQMAEDPIVKYVQPAAPVLIAEEYNESSVVTEEEDANETTTGGVKEERDASEENDCGGELTTEGTTEATTESQTTVDEHDSYWKAESQKVYEDITKQLSQKVGDMTQMF